LPKIKSHINANPKFIKPSYRVLAKISKKNTAANLGGTFNLPKNLEFNYFARQDYQQGYTPAI
jgi:hypothetical protein